MWPDFNHNPWFSCPWDFPEKVENKIFLKYSVQSPAPWKCFLFSAVPQEHPGLGQECCSYSDGIPDRATCNQTWMFPPHRVVTENCTHGHKCWLREKREEEARWECEQHIHATYLCYRYMPKPSLTAPYLFDDGALLCIPDFRIRKHPDPIVTWCPMWKMAGLQERPVAGYQRFLKMRMDSHLPTWSWFCSKILETSLWFSYLDLT